MVAKRSKDISIPVSLECMEQIFYIWNTVEAVVDVKHQMLKMLQQDTLEHKPAYMYHQKHFESNKN